MWIPSRIYLRQNITYLLFFPLLVSSLLISSYCLNVKKTFRSVSNDSSSSHYQNCGSTHYDTQLSKNVQLNEQRKRHQLSGFTHQRQDAQMKHFLKTKNCKVTIMKMVTMRLVLLFHECNGLFVIGRDDNPDIFMGFCWLGVLLLLF